MKKHLRRIISVVCALVLTFSSVMVFCNIASAETSWESKIDNELWTVIENSDKAVNVIIFRKLIGNDIKEAAVLKETGYEVGKYENEELFNEYVMPKITATTVAKYGEKAYSTEEYEKEHGEKISLIDIAVNLEYDKYIMAKRSSIAKLYKESNDAFIEKYIPNDVKINYVGMYTSTVIAEMPRDLIIMIAQDNAVESIKIFKNEVESPALNNVLQQINVDDITGSSYNSGSGYKGTGVKIGIIEASSGLYDPSGLQLNSIDGVSLFQESFASSVTGVNTWHATMVTSIIVGQPYTISGNTYVGVVPNATVYQAPAANRIDVQDCLNGLASLGVTVVNYSGGAINSNTYEEYDQEIDRIINETGVTLVAAAGNNGNTSSPYVMSPAKAFNAIAVGNTETVTNSSGTRTPSSSPYNMYIESAYGIASYLPTKPDITAPGTNIAFVYLNDIMVLTGTSCATPLVTGIVAQIMQARPTSKLKPTEIKAILLRGADNEAVTSTNNSPVWKYGLVRERSGLGFADAKATIDYLLSSSASVLTYNYDLRTISYYVSSTTAKYYTAGQKIRAVLVFNKPENIDVGVSGYGNDVDLALLNSSDQLMEYSTSTYNNVEVLEYTVITSGYYHFHVVVQETIPASEYIVLSATLAYGVEQ